MLSEGVVSSRRIVRSAVWRLLETAGTELLSLLFMLALVRLLTPEDFGVVAIALLFLATAQALVARGFPEAVVQRAGLTSEHLDAAFWANLGLAAVLAAALAALAAPAARLTAKPGLAAVLVVLAPLMIITAATNTYAAVLRREMLFKALAVRSFISATASGIIGITLAFSGAGKWSLVGQQVGYAVSGLFVLVLVTPWRPHFGMPLARLVEIAGFGARTAITSFTTAAVHNAMTLVLGVFLNAQTLGAYFIAQRLATSLNMFTSWLLLEVSLSVLSRLQHDPAAHREAAYEVLRVTTLVSLPSLVGIALVAELLIEVLFGPRWSGSVLPLQVLASFGIFPAFQLISGQILLSAGRPGRLMQITLLNAFVTTALVLPTAPIGLLPALVAAGVGHLCTMPFVLHILAREFGISGWRMLRESAPIAVATGVMVMAVHLVSDLSLSQSPTLLLSAEVATGVIAYVLALAVVAPSFLSRLFVIARAATRGV